MKYAKYKPTGIAWLPEVPEEWEVRRGRYAYSIDTGSLDANAEDADGLYPFFTCSMFPKRINTFRFDCEALLVAGNGLVGFTQYYNGKFNAYQRTYVLSDFIEYSPHYLRHYLGRFLRGYAEYNSVGSVISFITIGDLRSFPIPFPPLPTQRAIVAFLDEKCGKVDRLVAAKEKEVALLKELKQSMIAEAVCGRGKVEKRGGGGQRKFKPSGIPWLPEVPEGWEVLRNKTFLKLTDEKVGDRKSEFVLLSLTKQGVIIRDLTEMKGKFPKDFDTYLVVRPNNLVFCLFDVDETPRTVGLVRNVGMLTGAYTNFEVDATKVLPEFAYYFYLQVDDAKKLRPYYTGLRKVVKTNTFLQLRMPVPPLAEQREIVAHIEAKAAKIDAAVSGLEKEIAALKEYKQRLIADVVTGQRKVA